MTGIHDEVTTYEPKVDITYEGQLPKVDDTFDDITDNDGNISIVINSEVIGQTLAKKIYTSWSSALRELYNNEARACRMSKKMGGNPSIVITVDPTEESRQVTIQGVDSLGITKAMFNKVLRVIGTSGNTDGEEIGQYGMGFISYALMCDVMIMETWSRETNEHYSMLCDSGLKFKPIPIDTTNSIGNMTEYGTKLTMTCNDDVSFSELVTNVYKLARFSKIPTKVIVKSNIQGYRNTSYYSDPDDNELDYDAGVYECPSYDNGMDYLKDKPQYEWIKDSSSRKNHKKILTYREITIDNDDYRLDGIFAVVKSNYGTVDLSRESRNSPLFLVGTEIDSNINLSMLHDYVINIKNERKYSPVASRDSLETKAVGVLEEDIKDKLKQYFTNEFEINSIDVYNKSLDKSILTRSVMYYLEDYVSDDTNRVARTLNFRYSLPDKSTSTLSELLAGGGYLVCLKSLRQSMMDTIDEHIDGNVQFFRLPTRLTDEEKGHRIDLFKQLNIIIGEEYKKQHKLRESKGNKIIKDGKTFSGSRVCVLYNSTKGYNDSTLYGASQGWRSINHKYSTTVGDVNDNYHSHIISVDTKRFQDVIDSVNEIRNDWKVVHDMKGLSDKIMTVDKLVNKFDKKLFQTNKGLVKGSDLDGYYMAVVMKYQINLNEIPYVKPNQIENYLWGSANKAKTVTWLAIKDIEEYVALQIYLQFRTNKNDVTIFQDQFGETFKSILRNPITDMPLEFNSHYCSYDDYKTDHVARMYWIVESLPDDYADVYINAILHNARDIDRIELQAGKLKELLSQ